MAGGSPDAGDHDALGAHESVCHVIAQRAAQALVVEGRVGALQAVRPSSVCPHLVAVGGEQRVVGEE